METFLIFLAIIAIQMIAAYSKQKKEAEKRRQQQQTSRPVPQYEEPEYEEEEPKRFERLEEAEEFVPPIRPEVPFKSITDRVRKENSEPLKIHQAVKTYQAINTKNPEQGILWSAILQEPRYKVKWKRR